MNGRESVQVMTGKQLKIHEKIPDIVVDIDNEGLKVFDQGRGMAFPTEINMFIPATGGTKQTPSLSSRQEVEAELNNTAVYHDTKETNVHQVSFVRNEESIRWLDDIIRRDKPEDQFCRKPWLR